MRLNSDAESLLSELSKFYDYKQNAERDRIGPDKPRREAITRGGARSHPAMPA